MLSAHNVPGAFSSNKGNDFRAVLEETIRIAEPDAPDIPLPPKGKWPMADAWYGDGWSIAYRVLDAQFWGVPQRRRRIALVADFGGHAAPEILFVRQSVCGDIAESGTTGKTVAAGVGSSSYPAIALRMRAGCEGGGKGALIQTEKTGTLGCANDQVIFCAGSKHKAGAAAGSGTPREKATAGTGGSTYPTVARSLTARYDGSPCIDRGPNIIVVGLKSHAGANAGHIGYVEEKVPTIDTGTSLKQQNNEGSQKEGITTKRPISGPIYFIGLKSG